MKYITFAASGMLTGLANMLECLGINTEDYKIALGMEAPFLFMHEDGHYFAGSRLYRPRWLDLYLTPRGFRMIEIILPKEEVPAFLRSHQTAMLPLSISRDNIHPAVFTGYAKGRYNLVNIKLANSDEPDNFSFSSSMLRRRLDAQVSILTLQSCPPQAVDFLPLLQDSLKNLDAYLNEVQQALQRTVTLEVFHSTYMPLFRTLMQDMLPMSALIGDYTLAEELRLLNHDYRHVFTRNSPPTVTLWEKLPRSSIRKCVSWLKEDITDRIYVHTVQNEQLLERSHHKK